MFGKTPNQIAALSEQIAELDATLKVKKQEEGLVEKNNALREKINEKEIALSKIEEDHAKKIREVEHKVGLQQKAAEQERKAAVQEAELKVREANLDADKSRFEEQMKFEREAMQDRMNSQERLLKSILDRLPNHTVNENIHSIKGGTEAERQAVIERETGGAN